MCKEGEGNSKNSFVQMVNAAPYPMMLLAFNYMLDDLVRFCTSDSNFSVLGIDPTFSLGEFDVTVTTYRHLLLIPHREPTGKPPVMIGPLFVHLKGTYHFFSSSLVSLRKELSSLKAFGTDGEIALERAFMTTFTKAIHLRCFLHFRGNIEQKLRDLSIPSTVSKEIVKDIMGCPSRLELGLVDAQDSAQFDEMLLSLEKRWNEFEAPYNSPPKFYEWFKCNSQDVITRFMIRDVRESAGLGSPPEPYYTNEVESMNKLLKEEVNYKSSQLPDFVEKMKVMLYQQRQEIECALIDSGQYRVASGYESLRVDSSQWFRMTAEQRSRKIDCFMKAVVHDRHAPTTYSSPLEKLNLPHHLKESLWKKAHDLANHDSQITNAPGEESAWMVKSYTARQPHFVQSSKCRGGFLCDMQCLSYKSSKICSHTLAVAMKMGCLEKFLHWYEMKKHQPNFTALAEVGKPSTTGKKSSRKGITKKNSKIVKKFVTEAAETGWSNRCLQKDGSQNPFSVNISNNSHVQISSNNNYTPEPPPLPLILTPPPTQSSQLSTPAPFRQQGRPSVETPFWVAFIFGNVSRCNGCKGKILRGEDKSALPPPYDIVLGHKEYVIFQTSYSPVFQQSWDKRNVYYHPQKTCIEPNFCDFNPLHHISISEPVKARLLYEHKMLLQSEFGLFV